jgi:hypothetical protein
MLWQAVLALTVMGCSSPDRCLVELVTQVLRCLLGGC